MSDRGKRPVKHRQSAVVSNRFWTSTLFAFVLITLGVILGSCPASQDLFREVKRDFASDSSSSVPGEPDDSDTTPPGPVSNLTVVPGTNRVTLSWTDPSDQDFDHVEISWDPGGGAPQTVDVGAENYVAEALSNYIEHSFTVRACDSSGNLSDGATNVATPLGRIAFRSDRSGHMEIHAMDANGSNQTRLTYAQGDDAWQFWSPDAAKIAFTVNMSGMNEFYVMNADGSGQQHLGAGEGGLYNLEWSPDGLRLAYNSNHEGPYAIYVMDSNGGNQQRITDQVNNSIWPIWSPDGSQLAFMSDRYGTNQVFTMNPDGTNPQELTDLGGSIYDYYITWSPDSSKIAFAFDSDIYYVEEDGSSLRQLTTGTDTERLPAWSPDGSKIAYVSDSAGNYDIYLMDLDGGSQIALTTSPETDTLPKWSPDGSKIAFESTRDGQSEIYVMDADGNNKTRLTTSPGVDSYPVWSPK